METKSTTYTTEHHNASRIEIGGRDRGHAGSAHSGRNSPCLGTTETFKKNGDNKQNIQNQGNSNEQTTTYPRQTEGSRGE